MQINKKTLTGARLIHVYVSMALLTLLLFFSVTGITLNHPEWFSDVKPDVKESEQTLDMAYLVAPPLSPQQIDVVIQQVEQRLNLSLKQAEIESHVDELYISIKQAGANTSVAIDLTTGELFYEHTDYGWWALLNDLHKGRNTSVLWRWVLDLSSLLFIVFAVSGFILAMPQRRFSRTFTVSLSTTVGVIVATAMFA